MSAKKVGGVSLLALASFLMLPASILEAQSMPGSPTSPGGGVPSGPGGGMPTGPSDSQCIVIEEPKCETHQHGNTFDGTLSGIITGNLSAIAAGDFKLAGDVKVGGKFAFKYASKGQQVCIDPSKGRSFTMDKYEVTLTSTLETKSGTIVDAKGGIGAINSADLKVGGGIALTAGETFENDVVATVALARGCMTLPLGNQMAMQSEGIRKLSQQVGERLLPSEVQSIAVQGTGAVTGSTFKFINQARRTVGVIGSGARVVPIPVISQVKLFIDGIRNP